MTYNLQTQKNEVQSVYEPLKFFDKIHTTNVEIEF